MTAAPRIAITRPASQAGELAELLRERGAEPVLLPLLAIESPEAGGALERAAAELDRYDGVALTSRNAAEALLAALSQRLLDPALALRPLAVAAVGGRTAEALRRAGVRVDVVPERENAAALAEALVRRGAANRRFLVPVGDRALSVLQERLAAAGAEVTEVLAYRTVFLGPEAAAALERALLERAVGAVTFASGSAVDAFVAGIGRARAQAALARAGVAVLGATAAAALHRHSLPEAVAAGAAGAPALADAALRAAGSAAR